MRETDNTCKSLVASALCGLLVWTTALGAWPNAGPTPPLAELVGEPYLVLLERAHELELSSNQLKEFKKQLKKEEKAEKNRLKEEAKQLEKQIKGLRNELSMLNRKASSDSQPVSTSRHDVHCRIEALEKELQEKQIERKNGVPVTYDNRKAKLELIEKWPAEQEKIWNLLESGAARQRRFGDVEDIGIRLLEEGQENDMELGEQAVRDMRTSSLMPAELKDEKVTRYAQQLAAKIGAHSDLRVPLQVTVLDSKEINAFALPGGFLYVNRGLIEKAETESELAGVLAHEIAHVTARHGHRLMQKASLVNMLYQVAQIAAVVATGGAAAIGTYYALQYGFMGLGMALNLTLLGISRDFEEEADQLGAQYAWNAGYHPEGFITFFDKMATENGYVRSASFFRTHPAFYDRMVATFSEIEYLPPKDDLVVDSTEFQSIKAHLKTVAEPRRINTKRPRLTRGPQCGQDHPSLAGPLTDD